MDKLPPHSPDLTAAHIDQLAELFPTVVTEQLDDEGRPVRSIDFDLLRQELSDHIVEGPRERYQLDWPGKRAAAFAANTPIAKTLRPDRAESVDFDTTQNLFIEGDNLDALKLLQESYLGKVKLIYIDPPYNTGHDFIYNDDFAETTQDYLDRSAQVDDEGARLTTNTESNGRFHSDWLSMMYPRLKLARNLLTDDGVICISIDDSERDNLGLLMAQVFGEDNFVDALIWKKRYGGGSKEKYFVSLHEYVLVFARNIRVLPDIEIALSGESISRYYKKQDEHYAQRGPYRTHPLEATKSMDERPNLVYPIPGPDGDIWPERQWLWSKDRTLSALRAGELELSRNRNGEWTVHTKQYLRDPDGTQRRGKQFSIIDDVFTQHGTNEMIELFGEAKAFSFPKPTAFLQKIIDALSRANGDIILDFFAGSSSSAHAIMKQNTADGISRSFVMVQISEPATVSGATGPAHPNMAELSRERIRRAGRKIKDEAGLTGANLDVGFRALRVDSTGMADVLAQPDEAVQGELDLAVDSVKPDRTGEDLLFEVLLRWGVELTLPIERSTIPTTANQPGHEIFTVDDGALIACFEPKVDPDVIRAIADRAPLRAAFRDIAFATDADRINAEQIFAEVSPSTDVRVL